MQQSPPPTPAAPLVQKAGPYPAFRDHGPQRFDGTYEPAKAQALESFKDFEEFMRLRHMGETERKLMILTQTKLVAEYVDSFRSLVRKVDKNLAESTLINLFVPGLKLKTRIAVAAARPLRLADAYDIALAAGAAIESSLNKTNLSTLRFRDTSSRTPFSKSPADSGTVSVTSMKHDSMRNTPSYDGLSKTEMKFLRKSGCCFKCKQTGHFARNCPFQSVAQNNTSAQQDVSFVANVKPEDGQEIVRPINAQFVVPIVIAGRKYDRLIASGSQGNFIDPELAKNLPVAAHTPITVHDDCGRSYSCYF